MDKQYLVGVDIGGTKCAVTLGLQDGENIEIADKLRFPTRKVDETIGEIQANIREILGRNNLSCKDIIHSVEPRKDRAMLKKPYRISAVQDYAEVHTDVSDPVISVLPGGRKKMPAAGS